MTSSNRLCGLLVAGLATTAASANITYTLTGEITRADILRNAFVGIEVGDAFTMTAVLDPDAPISNEGDDFRRYDDSALVLFQIELPDRTFIYRDAANGLTTTTTISIRDNQDVEGFAIRDSFFVSARNDPMFGTAWFSFNWERDVEGDDSPISGLDFPTAGELDPALFDDASIMLGNTISTGFVDGRIDRVTVVPAPTAGCAVLSGLGLVCVRRRRVSGGR